MTQNLKSTSIDYVNPYVSRGKKGDMLDTTSYAQINP